MTVVGDRRIIAALPCHTKATQSNSLPDLIHKNISNGIFLFFYIRPFYCDLQNVVHICNHR